MMGLNEVIEILKETIKWREPNGLPVDMGDITRVYEAIKYIITILENIQDAEMPKKVEPEKEIGQPNWDYCKGYNHCYDEWLAYHTKKMAEVLDVDRISEILFNQYPQWLEGEDADECKAWCSKLAQAIAKEINK